MQLCIPSNYTLDSWPIIIIYLALTFATIVFVVLLHKLNQLRLFFPIRELTPSLTILQLTGIYFFTCAILLNTVVHLSSSIHVWPHYKKLLLFFLETITLIGRGTFATSSILKSLRVYIAFQTKLTQRQLITNLFSSETRLFRLSCILALIIWVLPFLLWTFLNQSTILRDKYQPTIKDLQVSIIICNSAESMIIIAIIYASRKIQYFFQVFRSNLFFPMCLYVLALFINLELSYFYYLNSECFNYLILSTYFVDIVRSVTMIVMMVYLPLKNAKQIRFPFPSRILLHDLKFLIQEELCINVFSNFLKSRPNACLYTSILEFYFDVLMFQNYIQASQGHQNFIDYAYIQSKLDYFFGPKNRNIFKVLKIPEDTIQNVWPTNQIANCEINDGLIYTLKEIIDSCQAYLNEIYIRQYQKTVSYQALETHFNYYEQANENFYKLNLNSTFYGAASI